MKKLPSRDKISFLRKKYPKFIYQGYSYKISKCHKAPPRRNLEIFFDFLVEPDIKFQPKIIVENINQAQIKRVGKNVLNNLIFHLGLVESISYWKAACSPEIIIKAGFLDKRQIKWWKNLILNGMGEFFYQNKINFTHTNFINIKNPKSRRHSPMSPALRKKTDLYTKKFKSRTLIPIGGGKDSAVTLEIFKKSNEDINCLGLNPISAAKKIIKIGRCKNPIIIRRKIDKKLLELNRKGFLNGHTPFTAYLSFLNVLCAVIFDYKFVAFSNERSSNKGNIIYLGKKINHQYSKSFHFEKLFRDYARKYLAQDIKYFSFLRPLYEIQIVEIFSNFPKYFSVFLSCNEAYKTYSGTKRTAGKWCGNCPKCLFVYTALYPFLKEKDLIKIFSEDLFEKKNLLPLMQELIGQKRFKPFECVGTEKESLVAFYLSWKKGVNKKRKLPFLLEYFERKILPRYKDLEKDAMKILNSWNRHNNVPKKFERILKKFTYTCHCKK